MMNQSQRRTVWILMAVIFICSAALSEVIRPGHEEYLRAGKVVLPTEREMQSAKNSALANSGFEACFPRSSASGKCSPP